MSAPTKTQTKMRPNAQRNSQPLADDIFAALRAAKIDLIAHVPDAGHRRLLDLAGATPTVTVAPLATEEDGIALLAGAWLGGRRGALLMQSSGVGNCINMLSLPRICRLPLLMIVTMRGQWGEFNPWQVPMGQASAEILKAQGVICLHVDDASEVGVTVEAAARLVFEGPQSAAVLLGQRLIGTKTFGK